MADLVFPDNFLWGTATASFTNEGAWDEDGKGESIWDRFAHTPGKIVDGATPDVACDHYHRYREDIALMRELGLNAYSFSIAWPRVYPGGFGAINARGLDFYDRLVDELLAAGLTPLATLYHWDLPQSLEDIGGWANREIAHHFADYASTCFERLADRVKLWFTVNEPVIHASNGYGEGVHAPGRKSQSDMFQAVHTQLLAHGVAVGRFRQMNLDGRIGAIVNQGPVHAAADTDEDHAAAGRLDAFLNRWFLDPIFRGDYPAEMKKCFPDLPELMDGDRRIIQQPVDFLGINYYMRAVVADSPGDAGLRIRGVELPDAEYTPLGWEIYPEGLYEALLRVRERYDDVPLYITENGASFGDDADDRKTVYLREHLRQAHRAIGQGIDLRGYFVYTLMDNFECNLGFTPKFGLVRTDFNTLERTIRQSGKWYGDVARSNTLKWEGKP